MDVDVEQMARLTKASPRKKFDAEAFVIGVEKIEKRDSGSHPTGSGGGDDGSAVTEKELDNVVIIGQNTINTFKKEGVKTLDKAFLWQLLLVCISVLLGAYSSQIPAELNEQIIVGFGIPITTGFAVIPTLKKEAESWLKNRTIIHNFCREIMSGINKSRGTATLTFVDQHTYLWRYINRLELVQGVLADPEISIKGKMDKLNDLLEVPSFPPPALDISILN